MGCISSTAFAPLFWTPTILIGFLNLSLYLRQCQNAKQAFIGSYFFCFGHFLISLYWITASLWIDITKFWIWVIPCLTILPFYFSFIGGIVGYIIQKFIKSPSGFYHLFFLGCLWICSEILRTYLWIPLPWNLVSYSLGSFPAFMQGAAIFGSYGLGILIFLAISLIETLIFWKNRPLIDKYFSFIIAIFLCIFYGWGQNRYQKPDDFTNAFRVRIVQPNIDQVLKWNPIVFLKNLEKCIFLSTDQRPESIQCVIWPETVLSDFQIYEERYLERIRSVVPVQGFLILGAQQLNFDTKNLYNSLLIFNDQLKLVQSYYKNHLVPFGEYIPLRKTFEQLGLNIAEISQSTLDITKGTSHFSLFHSKIPPFNPLICYEAIFPHFTIQSAPAPQWCINLTNDAWFGESSGPYQHLTSCRFRAIEQGIPIIRSANTGISAVINAKGKIEQALALNTQGFIDANIPGYSTLPLYPKYKELPFFILILIFLSLFQIFKKKFTKEIKYFVIFAKILLALRMTLEKMKIFNAKFLYLNFSMLRNLLRYFRQALKILLEILFI